MKHQDRRSFLKVAGMSLGAGALFKVMPLFGTEGTHELLGYLEENNGEGITPFTFVQLSDAHVGFEGPNGTKAFERAVDMINALPSPPDLVLFTGDLTHDTDDKDTHVARMKRFQQIAGGIRSARLVCVPGEHDAGEDGGALFREFFGATNYSFDHRGMHFIALDNVSRAKPEVGSEQLSWLASDLTRFPKSTPIVVFTHRPLFDLKPEWEWFTSDGDAVTNLLAPYENVTVLYGHIHRDNEHVQGHAQHYAARSLIFAFPDPTETNTKKPIPFDKDRPFKNLGIRLVREKAGAASVHSIAIEDVELSLREFSGTNGIQQMLKGVNL